MFDIDMYTVYEEQSSVVINNQAVLLVDASNAFNS